MYQIIAFGIGSACIGGLIVAIMAGFAIAELRSKVARLRADLGEACFWRDVHESSANHYRAELKRVGVRRNAKGQLVKAAA